MRADGSGQKRLTNVPGYDGGPFFTHDGKRIVWRRFDEKGLHRRRLDDEAGRHRPEADHRLRLDELGALHASVGRVLHLRVEQARVRELRAVHGRRGGHEGAGARHLLRRLRRPAGAVAGRQAAGVDVEPLRRLAPGSSSSRSGTTRKRSKRSKNAPPQKAEQRNHEDD